jgi:hypothetical protein
VVFHASPCILISIFVVAQCVVSADGLYERVGMYVDAVKEVGRVYCVPPRVYFIGYRYCIDETSSPCGWRYVHLLVDDVTKTGLGHLLFLHNASSTFCRSVLCVMLHALCND